MSTSSCAWPSKALPKVSFLTLLDRPWSELVSRWRQLDDLGAETVWVSDHLFNQQRPAEPWLGGWASLAGMASVTRRIRVGVLVSPPALHVTAALAKQIVTVDHISNGRLEVGLGAGGSSLDDALVDNHAATPSVRAGQFADFIRSLEQMLVPPGGAMELSPRPIQRPRPPFTIAGRSKNALRLAARHAARWNFYSVESSENLGGALRVARRLVQRLDRECAAAGREPTEVIRSILLRNAPLADHSAPTPEQLDDLMQEASEAGLGEVIFFHPLTIHFPDLTDEVELLEHLLARFTTRR
jgi:alkanesulfonate monooxygenase SsuD/methylene tetrahydromethanopterin reductase-like flavin-dependent oxidoreductase (luciferase family)